jgi:Ca2+-dependent lipid-binding protein
MFLLIMFVLMIAILACFGVHRNLITSFQNKIRELLVQLFEGDGS